MPVTANTVPSDYIKYTKKAYTDTATSGTVITAASMNNIEDGINKVTGRANDLLDLVKPIELYRMPPSLNGGQEIHQITVNYDVNNFNRLRIYGVTLEYRRCSVDLIKDNAKNRSFNSEYFTLLCYNGQNDRAYIKASDFQIQISSGKTTFMPMAYNEMAIEGSICSARTGLGTSIYAIHAYMI